MYFLNVLLRIVYSCSLIFNLMEIMYIILSRSRPPDWTKNPHLFVLNLALADITFGLGGVGKAIFHDLIFGKELDDEDTVFKLLFSYGKFSSLACTALLTLDRFIAVIFPLKYGHWRSKRSALLALGICWVTSVTMQLVYYLSRCANPETKYCLRVIISIAIIIAVFFIVASNLYVLRAFRKRNKLFPNMTKTYRRVIQRRVLYVAFLSTNCVALFTIPYAVVSMLKCFSFFMTWEFKLMIYFIFTLKSMFNPMIFFGSRYFVRSN